MWFRGGWLTTATAIIHGPDFRAPRSGSLFCSPDPTTMNLGGLDTGDRIHVACVLFSFTLKIDPKTYDIVKGKGNPCCQGWTIRNCWNHQLGYCPWFLRPAISWRELALGGYSSIPNENKLLSNFTFTWVFPKIRVPQKWMVYNGKPY